ncbi:MAG: SusC/RagA family TonB-linked outer membrane protein [Bernardetiaceae bacterium]
MKDEDGYGLVSATVYLKSDPSVGTVTDLEGNYQIKVPETAKTLVFSYVGYGKKDVPINGRSRIDVLMRSAVNLDEVIVTALGVEREEKALGYAVQQLSGEAVSTVKTTNPINALAGKISGVYITGGASGPTASANINIRGASSLLGNNQPLFVVNGMPITNDLYSFDDGLNGSSTIDFGNAAQIVNTDDIASVNVLKGAAASALYGSRAANGVILIQTKTGKDAGKSKDGWGVEVNTSLMAHDILKLPDYQNEFGFGGGGKYSYKDGSNYIGDKEYYEAYGENWGPRMNGQLIKQFNSEGQPVPFTPAPDNVRNFFRTGLLNTNNISINHYTEESDLRFSFSNLGRRGIVPNTNLTRNTFQTSIGRRLLDGRLKIRANAMYVLSGSDNIPNAGYDESSSIMYGWLWFPRQVEINDLRDYWEPGREGVQQRYVENLWVNNPWFIANENTNSFESRRLIGNLNLSYDFNENLKARFRYGADLLNEGRAYRRAPSTKGTPGENGSYREDEIRFSETNAELLLTYASKPGQLGDFDLDLSVGGNLMSQQANTLIANNPELSLKGPSESIYTLTNGTVVLTESRQTQASINSLFATTTLGYKGILYLDASYRHDWNSTLVNPEKGLAGSSYDFGYPALALSAIVSDMFDLPRSVSFFKVRSSFAEVGNGAPPYAFGNTFTAGATFGSQPTFSTNRTIADPNLTNERTRAYELGLDYRMFTDRLRLDLTYYNMLSFDQIIRLPVAASSGYDFTLTNGGEIRNKGVELMIAGRPVEVGDFSWDLVLNLGHNRAIVESLPDVITSGRYAIIANVFPGDGGAGLEYVAEQGELLGQLYGLGFQRGPDGRIIHENGLPLLTDEKVSAGSYQPDLRVGLNNTFHYKNLSFSFLFDGQIGGKIYSRSHALYNTGGAITNNDDPHLNLSTLDGRTVYSVSYDQNGDPVYTLEQEGGVIGPGWRYDDAGNLVENDVVVPAGGAGYTGYFYNYYGNGFNRDNIEAATYDATYFKLRQISISYRLPKSWVEKLGFRSARLALIGRNLLLFSKVPTIDPETYSIRNGLFVNGFESTQLPSTRSYGFSVHLGF